MTRSRLTGGIARGVVPLMLLAAASLWADVVLAQEFPSKPIRIIVPAAPGGALDTIARLIAYKAQELRKHQVFVENRPGANWIIGMTTVASAPPDGYTLLFIASSGVTLNPHVFDMTIDPQKDLVPVISTTHTDFVLLASPDLPVKSVQELIAHLRANPGKLNHASNSATTMLVSELFKIRAGVSYVDINYRGAAPALQDTIKGQTQFLFVDLGTGSSAIQAKTLRPLGITGAVRSVLNPDLPTIAEQGLPGYAVSSTTLLFTPAKTPPTAVQKLNEIFLEAVNAPDVKTRLANMGQFVVGNTSQEAINALRLEHDQFGKVIKERNIKFAQ